MTKIERKKIYKKIAKEFGKLILKYGMIAAEIYLAKEMEKLEKK